MRKNSQQEAVKYWQQIEEEIGEEIIGKEMCEFGSGFIGIEPKTWGLMYYTESSIYFHTFPKKNFWSYLLGGSQDKDSKETKRFQIRWDYVKEVGLPFPKKSFLSRLLPDYQVSIKFQQDGTEKILILLIYSHSARENVVEYFQKHHSKSQSITSQSLQ